ncbi:MAG: GNAT family N-acetyltransferase, partial [Defluviitaleaceae bacterium]|nr:GNAT family N-acetyltransferase [Defluviitaleaceae bacterium]
MIREATPADFEAFAALEKEVQRMHFDARPDTFIEAPFDGDIAKYRADFEASLQNECVKIFVYEENGDVLGYCKTEAWDYDQHPIYRDVVVLNISSIGVDEKARGRKIGTRLFNQAKAYAAEI